MKPTITFLPSGRSISVHPGTTVLHAARRAGVAVRTRCDGKAACLMCKVAVTDGAGLAPPSEMERRKLAGLDQKGIRLSCQARIVGDSAVELPEDPLQAAVRKQLQRQAEEDSLW